MYEVLKVHRPRCAVDTVIKVEGVAERGCEIHPWLPVVWGEFQMVQGRNIFTEGLRKLSTDVRPIVDTMCTCERPPCGVNLVRPCTVVVDRVAHPWNRGGWFLVHGVNDVSVGWVYCSCDGVLQAHRYLLQSSVWKHFLLCEPCSTLLVQRQ